MIRQIRQTFPLYGIVQSTISMCSMHMLMLGFLWNAPQKKFEKQILWE